MEHSQPGHPDTLTPKPPPMRGAPRHGHEARAPIVRKLDELRCPLLTREGVAVPLPFDDPTPVAPPVRRRRPPQTLVEGPGRTGQAGQVLGDRVGFVAGRDTARWHGGAPVRAGDLLVGESIDGYQPAAVDPEVWDLMAPQARRWVAMVPVEFTRQAVARLKPLAQYLAWRIEGGMDVTDPALVFRADDIGWWATTGCAHLKDGSIASYCSAVRTIGEYVAGPDTACPDRTAPIAKPDPVAPYTDHEFAAVLGAINGLRTGSAHHNAMALVAPSRGAGLGLSDLTGVVGTDISVMGDTVMIRVAGPRPRQVPVLAAWEQEVLRLAELCGDKPLFRPDRTQIGARDIERFCQRLAWIDAPRLSVTRSRNTWIVEHLAAGTPIAVLAEAAGTTPVSVARYAEFTKPVTANTARALLRRGPGSG